MDNDTENSSCNTGSSCANTTNSDKQQATTQVQELKHYICEVGNELMAKTNAVCGLITQLKPRSTIVYCSNKSEAEVAEKIIRRKGIDARRATSDLSDAQTRTILERLGNGTIPIVVAPEFLRPVLNSKNVQLVINHVLPENSDEYLKYLPQLSPGTSVVSIVGVKDFGQFHTLKKGLEQHADFENITVDADSGSLTNSAEQMGTGAKCCALCAAATNTSVEVKSDDTVAAEKFLENYGVTSPTSNLVTALAKINNALASTKSHAVPEKTTSEKIVSLEVELAELGDGISDYSSDNDMDTGNAARPEYESRDYRGRGRQGGNSHYNRTSRGERSRADGRGGRADHGRNFNRWDNADSGASRDDRYRGAGGYNDRRGGRANSRYDDSRRGSRGRDNRRDGERYNTNRTEGSKYNYRDAYNKSNNPNESEESPSRERNNFREREYDNEAFDSRLYIGQGTQSGLTENEFMHLATSVGEVDAAQIVRLKLRENYGFIDVKSDVAETLVNNLNGIEYNGNVLPVRITGRIKAEGDT